jgi:hypothetical protein
MKNLDRSKIVALLTGAIALLLSFAYLVLVQLLDFRGEMKPAPQNQLTSPTTASLAEFSTRNDLHPGWNR